MQLADRTFIIAKGVFFIALGFFEPLARRVVLGYNHLSGPAKYRPGEELFDAELMLYQTEPGKTDATRYHIQGILRASPAVRETQAR